MNAVRLRYFIIASLSLGGMSHGAAAAPPDCSSAVCYDVVFAYISPGDDRKTIAAIDKEIEIPEKSSKCLFVRSTAASNGPGSGLFGAEMAYKWSGQAPPNLKPLQDSSDIGQCTKEPVEWQSVQDNIDESRLAKIAITAAKAIRAKRVYIFSNPPSNASVTKISVKKTFATLDEFTPEVGYTKFFQITLERIEKSVVSVRAPGLFLRYKFEDKGKFDDKGQVTYKPTLPLQNHALSVAIESQFGFSHETLAPGNSKMVHTAFERNKYLLNIIPIVSGSLGTAVLSYYVNLDDQCMMQSLYNCAGTYHTAPWSQIMLSLSTAAIVIPSIVLIWKSEHYRRLLKNAVEAP